jgi:hypothetical protein
VIGYGLFSKKAPSAAGKPEGLVMKIIIFLDFEPSQQALRSLRCRSGLKSSRCRCRDAYFLTADEDKYPKATECLQKDRDEWMGKGLINGFT